MRSRIVLDRSDRHRGLSGCFGGWCSASGPAEWDAMLLRLVPVIIALALCAVGVAATAGGSGDSPPSAERLPDLDQELPWDLQITGSPGRYRLGFASAVRNVGRGPLIISGKRLRVATPDMTASQLIERRGAPLRVVEDVGRLRYVRSPDHEHWHLLRFDRYELRRASDFSLVGPDRKTGFCLGDRYNVDLATTLPGEPANRVYNTNCGPGTPDLLSLEEGISVGWGDNYEPWRDGQYVELTGLAPGRYVLVHRVNPGRRLHESRYTNNASSVLLRLTWPSGRDGVPRVKVLKRCPNTARCPAPS
jgi:Lysyl oxidase